MPEISPGKFLVQCSWDQVPHLDEATKREMLLEIDPYLRDARTKGLPSLGSGAIYPVPESEVVVQPFQVPMYFPRAYAMDVGWNCTAVVWGALDPSTDVVYLYTEHYRGRAEPSVHASAIRARGEWIPGVIDPNARGRAQKDGIQLLSNYTDLGLDLEAANNLRESGIHAVFERLSTGRLKIFSTMQSLLGEYRIYRRDEDGNIVKKADHAMDAMRYLIGPNERVKGRTSGVARAITRPSKLSNAGIIGSATGGDSYIGY